MAALRVPLATYRLQFNRDFGFAQAKAIIPYLHDLGITDLYVSPIFHARTGSAHGYDVVDPNRLNPDLGTAEEFKSLIEEARRYGMGWIQDIVPNHMAYDGQNRMLMDVLENGEASPYFDYFDIEWNHPYESINSKILAPFLGAFYGECLENGEIVLGYDHDGLSINYYALRLPVAIESYSAVFSNAAAALRRNLGGNHPDVIKLLGVLYVLKNLPSKEEARERAEQVRFVKSMLWELYTGSREVKQLIDTSVARFNGTKGDAESFNPLDQLLSQQHYRLSFWKVAAEEVDYRRFFNINELISLKVEDEKVFRDTHSLIFKLVREEKFTGLRIDHIDGLFNPFHYLSRLRQELGEIYIVVEKILGFDEKLPQHWPVHGTTGYDFLNFVNEVFCEPKNERRFSQIFEQFCGYQRACPEVTGEKKRLIIGKYMAGDIENLAHLLKRISSRDRHAADVTLYGLKRALVEILTFFPVYRSYVSQENFSEQDRLQLREAILRSKEINPGLLLELNFIQRFLLLQFTDRTPYEERMRWTHFVMRFQQLTGPLMAKGFEDTTLYVYNRLLSLNDVGGNPGRFGVSLGEFHKFNRQRSEQWLHSMNATSTHDTKRGEDVRARINVLSELPDEWARCLQSWHRVNRNRRSILRDTEVPDRNDEYFLYQTLLGALPLTEEPDSSFLERLKAYVIKAVREAKVHTEWLKPDLAYEEAFTQFVEKILKPSESNPFLHDLVLFAKKIAHYVMLNSLSQTLLKLASPGVPDFYQGTELWNLSFVDPDNRRPVDFKVRNKLLRDLKERTKTDPAGLLAELRASMDGRIKLFLIHRILQARKKNSQLFQSGSYLPLEIRGQCKDHVASFARRHNSHWAIAVAPRMLTGIVEEGRYPLGPDIWKDTRIVVPDGAPVGWQDAVCGHSVVDSHSLLLGDVLKDFPVALLLADAQP